MPATYLAPDGIEYPLSAEQLPDETAWDEALAKAKAQGANGETKAAHVVREIKGVNVVVEKKYLTPAQKRALYGTLQVRLVRSTAYAGHPSGITLKPSMGGGAYPTVTAIDESQPTDNSTAFRRAGKYAAPGESLGVVARRKLCVGDRIKMINFVECSGDEAGIEQATQKLNGAFEVHLCVLRNTASPRVAREGKPQRVSDDSQQLHALLWRTRLLQTRQWCLCCASFLVPLLCMVLLVAYQYSVANRGGSWLGGLFIFQELAYERGCSNSTAQLRAMCEGRLDEASSGFYPKCEWCEFTLRSFETPTGRIVDQCAGTLLNDFTPGANGDQCISDFFDGGKARFSQCIPGEGRAYQSEAQLPAWCDCSSKDFELIVNGTTYCKLHARAQARKLVDREPMKVPRNFDEPGSGFLFTEQRVPQFIPDDWADYVGWRIAIAAPAALNVGSMGGYIRGNGYLGTFEERSSASDAARTAVDAAVQTSGLVASLPRGLAYAEPAAPSLVRRAVWSETRTCNAHTELKTCCANTTRRPAKLRDPPWFGVAGCFEATEKEANLMPWRIPLCVPCSEFPSAGIYSERIFIWPQPTECQGVGPPPGKISMKWDVDTSTKWELCETPACLQSTCSPSATTGVLRNPRCDGVLPAMTARCASMKAEVAAACTAATTWRHPASVQLLSILYSAFRGTLGVTSKTADTRVGPSLAKAFVHAEEWSTARGQSFDPATSCAPPFCFDFAEEPGSGASNAGTTPWTCSIGSADFDSLKFLYPCFVHNATLTDYRAAGTPPASVMEGELCREAYSSMATVTPGYANSPNWARVPECSPSSLGGSFFNSCGDCESVSCPKIPHYATPLYQPVASLDTVAADVLRAQFAVRDGTANATPTLPLFRKRQATYDQKETVPLSNELEQMFPSVAVEFESLDLQKVDTSIKLASFWGDEVDWPYVRAPPSWAEGETRIRITKFQEELFRERWIRCGGMASVLLNWVTNGLLKAALGDAKLQLTVGMKPFPYEFDIDNNVVEQTTFQETMTSLIDLVVPLGSMFALPLMAATVVMEKEGRLRALMRMMGLRMRFYWLSEWLYNSATMAIINLLVVMLGAAGGLEFFTRSTGLAVVLALLWSQCLVALAVLCSTFYNRSLTSYAGNSLMILVPAISCYVVNTSVASLSTFPVATFLFAPIAYFRAIHLLTQRGYPLGGSIGGEMSAALGFLALDVVLYGLLALYFDRTLTREFGVGSPLPCSKPWKRYRIRGSTAPAASPITAQGDDPHSLAEDSDVRDARGIAEERARAPGRPASACDPIELASLRKHFPGGKVAVHNLSLSIGTECFGLLGPNGAGKTTTISMLTGLYPSDGGSARICGHDLATELDAIYQVMGVCPQFDILWPLLTVVETLRFYCQLKGVPKDRRMDLAIELAMAVDLGHALDRPVGQLSGGMKRRVSLAIALCGEPRVIFLDEPSTGLDPETKRIMWSLVEFFSNSGDRTVVLTTHSMEEADALCGRIGIMAHGRLRCLGTSLHLKNKFGGGYKLEVALSGGQQARDQEHAAAVDYVCGVLGQAAMHELRAVGGVLTFQLAEHLQLSKVLIAMAARPPTACIANFALRQTSMEEVFLSIALNSAEELQSTLAPLATTKLQEMPAREVAIA